MPSTKSKKYTQEEYLELERQADYKSEYFRGEIIAKPGASLEHNIITGNFFAFLHLKLKGRNCRPFSVDMRLHIPVNTLYAYPDLMVICGKEELLDQNFDTVLIPPSLQRYFHHLPWIMTQAENSCCIDRYHP